MSNRTKHDLLRFVRSAGIGVLASAIDVLALLALVELTRLTPAAANVPALALGIVVQFVGNKYFAFRDRSRAVLRQGVRFAAIEVGALVLNGLSFHLVVQLTIIPYIVARLVCSAGVYAGYSFPLWGLIFRPGRRLPATREESRPCSMHC